MTKFFALTGLLLVAALGERQPALAQRMPPPVASSAPRLPAARLGIWQGQAGTRRFVLTLGRDSSTLVIPESGQPPARLAKLLAPADSLVAQAQYGKPEFRGRFSPDGRSLSGTYVDYSRQVVVVLRRVPAVQPLHLAQAPQLPLPYRAEEVQFRSADDSLHFGGTLTHPPGPGRVPAVVLLSGTYPQDRNGAFGPTGHQPFEVLADYLTRRGFAVLRTDDRGVGQTTGVYDRATTADFAHDALAAVRYLQGRPDIDPARVGLLGHSEGGSAAVLAAAESPDVAFVVSLAGLLNTGMSSLLFQNTELVRVANIPARNKARFNEVNGILFHTAYQYADSPAMATQLRTAYQAWKAKDDAQLLTDKADNNHFFYPFESFLSRATGPWYRYHVRFDPAPALAKVKVPVLAINGDRDLMVDYHGLDKAAATLRQVGNKDVTTRVLPGLNHLLQPCRTCLSTEYDDLDMTIDPSVLREVGDWITQHAH